LRVDVGGTEIRVRFSNDLGRDELHIGAASLARVSSDGTLTGDVVALRFAGNAGVVIPPGTSVLCDPVRMTVARFDDLAINTFFPEPMQPSGHRHQVLLSAKGNHSDEPDWPERERVRGATAVSGVQMRAASTRRVLVAFGDSITEGAGATPGAHMSWPAQLSRRLAQRDWASDWIVVNAGISGNRILHDGGSQNGLARFDRDALSVAGVTDVILLEGVNDLGVAYSPKDGGRDTITADDLIFAYRQMIERARMRGIRLYGATILPYEGAAYYSSAGEAERVIVNDWIRNSGAFDGVIDLDAIMRDPENTARLIEAFEIGDRLHPGDAGYAAMAEVVERFLASQPAKKPEAIEDCE
jgi:lysophospholipase L1-like esterase